MDVGRTEGVHGPGPVEGPRRVGKTQPSEAPSSTPPSDKVEISSEARLVSELMSMPDVRQDKIDEIKKQIESGEYETPERLEKAIEQFLSENQDLIS